MLAERIGKISGERSQRRSTPEKAFEILGEQLSFIFEAIFVHAIDFWCRRTILTDGSSGIFECTLLGILF